MSTVHCDSGCTKIRPRRAYPSARSPDSIFLRWMPVKTARSILCETYTSGSCTVIALPPTTQISIPACASLELMIAATSASVRSGAITTAFRWREVVGECSSAARSVESRSIEAATQAIPWRPGNEDRARRASRCRAFVRPRRRRARVRKRRVELQSACAQAVRRVRRCTFHRGAQFRQGRRCATATRRDDRPSAQQ